MENAPEAPTTAPAEASVENAFIKEKWRKLSPPFDDYEISSIGRFKTNVKHSGQLISPNYGFDNGGYKFVAIRYRGKRYYRYIHRLVSEAFNPNPYNKPQVNHKNGNKSDNRAENLEWATKEENERHSTAVIGKNMQGAIRVMCVETGKLFESCKEAARFANVSDTGIRRAIAGRAKSSGGFHWKKIN